jgi:2-polyprenyl-6-methoxyphenol hydroxylase-like FAD-dependent oxidoreductase
MNKGRVAIVGAGPGGMAAALAAHRVGFEVAVYERYREVKPAGNILNLWPPPQKVLQLLGVDTHDLGAPVHSVFRRYDGHMRADVRLPDDVVAEYGGGFIGLLRWGLYKRMIDALPEGVLHMDHRVTGFDDRGDRVVVHLDGRDDVEADVLVGADGIQSLVREELWGAEPIRNQHLHLVGGYVLLDGEQPAEGIIAHDRDVQGSYTAIRHEGRGGYEWWVLTAWPHDKPFTEDVHAYATRLAAPFAGRLTELVAQTPPEHLQRWQIRDRKPMKQWSKGRATLLGDAAHPTSPYAAYGAGMSIEDGYFLARELDAIDVRDTAAVRGALQAYEDRRKPHTRRMSQLAYYNGWAFHRMPRVLRPLRDAVFDRTPLLQKVIGDSMPADIVSQLAEIEDPEPRPTVGGVATPPSAPEGAA